MRDWKTEGRRKLTSTGRARRRRLMPDKLLERARKLKPSTKNLPLMASDELLGSDRENGDLLVSLFLFANKFKYISIWSIL